MQHDIILALSSSIDALMVVRWPKFDAALRGVTNRASANGAFASGATLRALTRATAEEIGEQGQMVRDEVRRILSCCPAQEFLEGEKRALDVALDSLERGLEEVTTKRREWVAAITRDRIRDTLHGEVVVACEAARTAVRTEFVLLVAEARRSLHAQQPLPASFVANAPVSFVVGNNASVTQSAGAPSHSELAAAIDRLSEALAALGTSGSGEAAKQLKEVSTQVRAGGAASGGVQRSMEAVRNAITRAAQTGRDVQSIEALVRQILGWF